MTARVVVAAALASRPANGGGAWVRLSLLLGLRRLGVEGFFVEVADGPPEGAAYFDAVLGRFGLADKALLVRDGDGTAREQAHALAADSDLLLNVGGHLRDESLLRSSRRSAFLDLDPGFTHAWHAAGVLPIPPHDAYFSVGANVEPRLAAGIDWIPTRPPVVLEEWPVAPVDDRRFTTVATWRGPFGRVELDGRTYGIKLDEFRKVLPLPRLTGRTFELALDIHADERRDLEALRENGWQIVDPARAAGDPDAFRRYVQGSGAEFSVAQGIYVETRSGWFSDRTTCYLASGKPAVVQDTGFGSTLSRGEGLLTFTTLEEAAAAAERVLTDYDRHARAARAVAEEHFDSDRVLAKLLEDALA